MPCYHSKHFRILWLTLGHVPTEFIMFLDRWRREFFWHTLRKENTVGKTKGGGKGCKQCRFCWRGGERQLCEGWWEGAKSWHRVGQRQHCHYNSKNKHAERNPTTLSLYLGSFHPSKPDGCYIRGLVFGLKLILLVVLCSSSTNQKQGIQSLWPFIKQTQPRRIDRVLWILHVFVEVKLFVSI